MSAALSVSNSKLQGTATVSLTGASATTSYVLRIVHPEGATEVHTIKTDGSGNATQTYVPQEPGTCTVNLDPVPTTTGVTATTTATHSH